MKKRLPILAAVAVLLVSFGAVNPLFSGGSGVPVAQAAPGFGAPAFQKLWLHTDGPVDSGAVHRSFLWGPAVSGNPVVHEFYANSPQQVRLVQYFDKTRMELNNPYGNANSPYYVSNGLLVVEMISGNRQEGDNTFQNQGAADNVPVAGDPQQGNANAPTYASFLKHASLDPETDAANRATSAIGSNVTATFDKAGKVGKLDGNSPFNSDSGAKISFYDQNLGHNIPAALYNYLTQSGPVQNPADGSVSTDKVFDWYAAMGFPITEPYWTQAVVAGQLKDVLVQNFQRRVLTYTPSNPDGFKVEMGNVGQHYLHWRYPNDTPIDHAPAAAPAKVPNLAYGINAHLYYQDKSQITGWVNDLGVRWVREQITWKDIEDTNSGTFVWGELDNIVNALYNQNIHIILSPVGAPTAYAPNGGIPSDTSKFGGFMYNLAQHYKGKVDAYEIWNEENLSSEAGKPISFGLYAQLLKNGYNSVKAGDPYAIVIMGALTPTGVNDPNVAIDDVSYLNQLFKYNNGQVKQYYDVLGAHPGNNNNPPDTFPPDKLGPGTGPSKLPCVATGDCWQNDKSFYFRRIEQLHQVMVDNGQGDKQMWLTEFGWDSTKNSGLAAPAGYEYADVIDEATQAKYIGQAYQIAQTNYPWMGVMALWNLNFSLPTVTVNANDEKVGWSILHRDGTKRPSYDTVKQYAHTAK